jgi:hypothetical protein
MSLILRGGFETKVSSTRSFVRDSRRRQLMKDSTKEWHQGWLVLGFDYEEGHSEGEEVIRWDERCWN